MQTQLERAELLNRLLAELENGGAAHDELIGAFGRTLVRRVDDAYLFRHRLTTLSGQIRDSLHWLRHETLQGDINVRVFSPTQQTHGYEVEGVVIETVMPDQSFIYDTLKLLLEERDIRVLNSLRMVIPVAYNDERKLTGIGEHLETSDHIGYTRWYVTADAVPNKQELAATITHRLSMARSMFADFRRMVKDVRGLANDYDFLSTADTDLKGEFAEVRDFLNWLLDDHFVFVGLSHYEVETKGQLPLGQHLGIDGSFGDFVIDPDTETFVTCAAPPSLPLARVRKSSMDSRLHRRGKIDELLVRTFDTDLKPTGAIVLHGLFTYKGLVQYGGSIPILRGKLGRVLATEGLSAGDHDHKSAVSAFNSLPVEFLFEADDETVVELIRMTRSVDDRQDAQSHIVPSPDRLSAYIFVALPKQSFSDELRAEIEVALRAILGSNYVDHRVHLGKYGSVTLHFYITCPTAFSAAELTRLEERITSIATPWEQRLKAALEANLGEAAGTTCFRRHAEAFSDTYYERVPVDHALVDIRHIEALTKLLTAFPEAATTAVRFDILPMPDSQPSAEDALLRIYSVREFLLTDILPVVDNFGVVVAEQMSYEASPEDAPTTFQINVLRIKRGDPDLFSMRSELIDGLDAVFKRHIRSDRINRLLLKARINWREVEVLRALYYYGRQLGSNLTPEVVQKTLVNHHHFVHKLIELFRNRFNPDLHATMSDRLVATTALGKELRVYLDGVRGADEDRILRMFVNLIESMLRTNHYRERSGSVYYTSFKFDCAGIDAMPAPKPMFEIFVHATDLEGVHLRGGRVARGGIRWSDRLDDYRSEVLGLVTTQMLKNAVIVPVGAKGGFVLKTPPEDWQEARAQADAFYRVYVRGILDLTDNLDGETVIRPPNSVCHDEPDPYMVVAADKGTAHLSDTANALAAEYGFWLGDAFASGGSVGYDHKIKGITARGAWVCVRRHFAEVGMDPNRDIVSVVGIGDMSGDVFGNGLLSSRTIKLIGAFDHRHIFVDPNPDPEISFVERERLFQVPRSKWTDYNPTLISEGGGIYERGAKAITLSAATQKRFQTERETVSGDELIHLLLKAEVDLLWNGGIGTYVKAAVETHADVRDAANDRVRVDANELRCRMIGEGGNLGLTTRARSEYASLGGRINLDAIDNSGGVDLSDHEVNLKTLLQLPMRAGELDGPARNALIASVGDEVCDLVLADNEGQALALSLDEVRSRNDIWAFQHGMIHLAEHTGFSRYVEHFPRTPEVIRMRQESGRGFLRPELGKLLSYAKVHLARALTNRPEKNRDDLLPLVEAYFPKRVVAEHGPHLANHFLFHEIAATVLTNRLVDRAGIMAVPLLEIATERGAEEIAAAWLLGDELLGAGVLAAKIHDLETITTDLRYQLLLRVEEALIGFVRTLLWQWPDATPVSLGARAELAPVAAITSILFHRIAPHLPERNRRLVREDARNLEICGVPEEMARELARIGFMAFAPAIAPLITAGAQDPTEACQAFFIAGYASRGLDLVETAIQQGYSDRWDYVAIWPIARSLLQTVQQLAGWMLKLQEHPTEFPELAPISHTIEDALSERVPVSAMLVLSDRLKRGVQKLNAGQ